MEKKHEILEVTLMLRRATPQDLKKSATELKLGMPFWVRSIRTGNFDNGVYFLTEDSNLMEIKHWLDYGMIYIPVSSLDTPTATTKPTDDV